MNKTSTTSGLFRKTGDRGVTDLASGQKISKSSARVDLIGDIDELISVLGAARAHISSRKISAEIVSIQKSLFSINTEIAGYYTGTGNSSPINQSFMDNFETRIMTLKKSLPAPKGFVIPGNSKAEAFLHVARTVTRRCERKAVALFEANQITNKTVLAFLNRLSSFLFLMANSQTKKPLYLNLNKK